VENSKGGLAHKTMQISSARAADDEAIRCKMNDFFDLIVKSLKALDGKK
jgi:hypothetical protein